MKLSIIEKSIGAVMLIGLIGIGVLVLLRPTSQISTLSNDQQYQFLLQQTNQFIGYKQQLEKLNISTNFFSDPRFKDLDIVSARVDEQTVGKSSIFEPPR